MIIGAFLGAAGTGKTTRLMSELDDYLAINPLRESQRVLALTRMHGSRLRLIERLTSSRAARQFECHTFDRFAWELSNRWRSMLREQGIELPSEFEYDATCKAASELLANETVLKWVAATYPIVLIDEFQDCRDGRLEIARRLSSQVGLLVAADDFQDLSDTAVSESAAWLREQPEFEELTTIYRTTDTGLIQAAHALRTGCTFSDTSNFKVFSAANHNVSASYLARGIAWSGRSEVVIISATNPNTSPWVRETLTRLAGAPFEDKKGQTYGPYHVRWEQSRESMQEQLTLHLGLPENDASQIDRPTFAPGPKVAGQNEIERWIETQYRLKGHSPISCGELRAAITRTVQHFRSHSISSTGLRAMTIHQAKNREFDRVFVLWPVQVRSDPEMQRRLLYNAITRAKNAATIIVQNPKPQKSRLLTAPFFRNS